MKAFSTSPSDPGDNPSSLVEVLRWRAEKQPERVAYTFLVDGETNEQSLTYGELDRQARVIGAWLQSYGSEGERVLLLYPTGLQYLAAFFGCLYAGAIAVSAHVPRLNRSLNRLQAIVANAEAKFVLATAPILSKLETFAEHAPYLKSMRRLATDQLVEENELAEAWKQPAIGRETLAFLQYTSGSTATPKGVMISHGNIIHNSIYLNAGFAFTPESVSLVWAPHFHDMGLILGLIQPLFHGFHGFLMPPASFLQRPMRWLEAITRYRITHTGGPNSTYDLCVQRSNAEQRVRLALDSWRVAYNGAEPVRPETLERFVETFAPCGFRREAFNPAYGLAEATLKVTSGRSTEPPIIAAFSAEALRQNRGTEVSAEVTEARRLVSSGHAECDMLVRIVHPETGVECRPEEIGEVWVSGPSVAKGYWKRFDETQETFQACLAGTREPQFLRTADSGFLRDGELFITGRLKDLIIINGLNHYPQDIEKTVEECHPTVRAGCCAAFSVEAEGGEQLVIVAEVERGFRQREGEANRIFAAIRHAVAEQHELHIHHIRLLKTGRILKTTSGKIQRRACREGFLDGNLETLAQWPPSFTGSAPSAAQPKHDEDAPLGSAKESLPAEHRTAEAIEAWLIEKVAAAVRIDPRDVDARQPFAGFGMGSLQSVGLSGELAEWLGRSLPPTLLYEYPTIASLTKFLTGEPPPLRRQTPQHATSQTHADALLEPVAIIGMGCRFPGAESPEAFWQLLRQGGDAITEYEFDRWRTGEREPSTPNPATAGSKKYRGGFLPQVDLFDAHFFSISPREASSVDPQQRLILEAAWEALEAAGQSPAKLAGSQTGVFIGISSSDYQLLQSSDPQARVAHAATGISHSIAANRLSYLLDLCGPSIAVDTACSSSLVAVHLACQSLQRGESRLALAGGVNLILNPDVTDDLARAGMLSADGRCKVFDTDADGYVRAEGCGVVVLKRLSDALRDGDPIVAQIKASAINQDGRSNGLTAPNGLAQQAVICDALEKAGVAPSEIDFVETHGSGTSLGDPIEVNSLISVLSEARAPERICFLGSVKANIGHLEAAAGIAGLIKAALALSHGEIPPQLHLRKINPHIRIENTPFSVATRLQSWPTTSQRRRAGVSSFGFGGTNAHIVLEESPPSTPADAAGIERPMHLLTLSARSETALRELARQYETFLKAYGAAVALADICFTANIGRSHLAHRLAIASDSHDQCIEKLAAFVAGREAHGPRYEHLSVRQRPSIAFLIGDPETTDADWMHHLSQTQPTFRRALDECNELLGKLRMSLRESASGHTSRFLNDDFEPSVSRFAVQYALAQMWMSWGIVPDVLLGAGLGECVAACVAGVIQPEEALRLILDPGHAAGQVEFKRPRLPVLSAQTGSPLSAEELTNPTHRQRRREDEQPSQMERALSALDGYGCRLFLDFGLAPLRLENNGAHSGTAIQSRLPARGDWPALLDTLAQLYLKGIEVDWERFDGPYRRRRVALPTYPFERKRYWLDVHQDSVSGVDMSQTRQLDGMKEASPDAPERQVTEMPDEVGRDEIRRTLSGIVAELLGMRAEEIDPHAPFLEMGADSIVLVTAIRTIENSFRIKISIRQLFEELTTIDALASHIARHAPPAAREPEASIASPNVAVPIAAALPLPESQGKVPVEDTGTVERPVADSNLERVMQMQLEAFTRLASQQLSVFGQGANGTSSVAAQRDSVTDANATSGAAANTLKAKSAIVKAESAIVAPAPYVPYRRITPGANGSLSDRQAKHLEALIGRYTKRTQKSKQLAQEARPFLADSRASVGFRLSVKEMLYPITGVRSAGSRIWDIDGNEYIDVTMGFGVHLFGHRAPFIQQALEEQLQGGIQLGPRVEYAREVAELICELSGHERVAFCNSGTEAVMTALRLARAATGRSKIAIFSGSYHGHSDGTLAIADGHEGQLTSMPMAPGVPAKVAEDVLVLEYGSAQALDYLKAHAHELAGVLVEPVQSRNPGLQPREFLLELRELTKAAGTPLIFDEMVTGFRVHPGGAQAVFGVKADLATYGKIIGGGLPIGVVAGQAAYMNGIDGGMWAYGDASYPHAETTFFGGTFCMHPLAMSAALATLKHLKREGPELHQHLNQRTAQFAASLNAYFAESELSLRIANFGSLFRFIHSGNMDLFYYHLLEKGIYIWEWRSCFLSTAHTPQDFDAFARAVKDSLEEMREGGFLPERTGSPAGNASHSNGDGGTHAVESAAADGAALINGRERQATPRVEPALNGRPALSDAQKQLWLLAEMGAEASLAYHESVIVELEGAFDFQRMRQAFRVVLNRHETLRTAVEDEGDYQQISSTLEIEMPLVDFTATDDSQRQAAIDTWLKNEARRPFELSRPPLWRVYVLKLEERKHLLVIIAHHIIIDSWSLSLILQEAASVYSAGLEGTTCELSPPMQFNEYLRELSQPDYLQRLQQAEAYWLTQLHGQTYSLSLTTARPPAKKYHGARVSTRIRTDLCEQLKTYSRQKGCTLFMTLFAGYSALLHRLTGQEELVVGIPVSGRFVEGSESLVGYCTHLLPVISRLEASTRFSEHLRSNRGVLLGAYEHQEYPFAKLIHLLNPGRDLSRTPIIQTTFNLEPNATMPVFAGLKSTLLSSPVFYTKFDLGANVLEIDGELRVDFDYDSDLFDASFIERMVEQFRMLLEGALARPAEQLAALPLMTEGERHRLLVQLNETRTPFPQAACVHELMEEQAQLTPEATAVVFQQEQLTYRDLNRRANRLAHYLRGLGMQPESRVGVCIERSPEMVIALLGIMKAGYAYVPLAPEYPRERLAYMIEDAQASLLLVGPNLSELFAPRDTPRIVDLDTLWSSIATEKDENPPRTTTADNLVYVIYTSGSTGRPKGVQITHSAVVNLLTSMRHLPGLTQEDALLAVTTISFDIAALELFLPLTVGARLVIASRDEAKDGERLSQIISDAGITAMQATPATWRLLIAAGWSGTERLKILCGGEALPEQLAGELLERGASLWNMYGPTETTIWSTTGRIEAGDGGVPIGRPIANTQIYILDAQLQPVPPGMAGELYIAGSGLSRGYLNRADITAEKFIPHPFSDEPGLRLYRTGDLARYGRDEQIELLGRIDHQVKLRGYRIELGEIESALSSHPAVREAVVLVRGAEPDDQRLVAYVVSRQDELPASKELSVFLSRSLPDYMIPSVFVALDALPRYPNGKVNRGGLPRHDATRTNPSTNDALPQTRLEQTIAGIWKEVLKVEKVGLYDNFFDLGGHSLLLAQVHRKLRTVAEKEFTIIEMFKYPTIAALAGYLNDGHDAGYAPDDATRRVFPRREAMEAGREVAIIGMAGRFPGAKTIEEFWSNLHHGVESITFFTEQELEARGVARERLRDRRFVRAGAVLDDVELFDAGFFGFSPREAEATDPQHRLFLECAWEALEHAGYDAENYAGAIGVFASVGINTYLLFNLAGHLGDSNAHSAYQTFIGNDKDFVPSRTSYKLNLRGPSINVQTACSSSLVGVHMACQSLLSGESDMTLVGGIAVQMPSQTGYLHDEHGIDSPDGHCRAFDAQAGGTIFGSGVGIVVLKRLADALRDGDYIHAVIKGSAVNNDGSHKISFTAPSEDGQAEVIRTALAVAQVEPESIGYVEAHGTGTHLGDPIEIAALTKVFGRSTETKKSCAIGSVKTNIGHLDTAAGIAGLIKTALSLKHRELAPSLHFREPNPQIDFAHSPFYVNDSVRAWERGNTPRRAGVSSFGIGGTNAHVVLEEAPAASASSESGSRTWQLLTLSAKTESALETMTANLAEHLRRNPDLCLADVAHTLHVGRRSFEHRRVVVCREMSDALASLERLDTKRVLTGSEESKSRPVAFLFPGQGTQYVEMAQALYQTETSFRQTVDDCARLLTPHLDLDVRHILYPSSGEQAAAAQRLNQTALAQPALFVIEYALARLWMEWGIEPQAMLGHSIGEYVAACLSGLFSLEDALTLVAARGRLMQSLPGGSMLAVSLAEDEARTLLNKQLSLAAVNGALQCIISGETGAIERLETELNGRGMQSTRLRTSHAFHSVMMEPVMELFARETERVEFKQLRVPYVSNLTGDWISTEEVANPSYWVRQLRETVRFADGLSKLLENPQRVLLEVGPGQSLAAQARRHPQRQATHVVVSSMRHTQDPDADVAVLLTALGRLWLAGASADWSAFNAHERRTRVPLPTYPFERLRYWIDEGTRHVARAVSLKRPNPSQWFYLPYWKPSAPLARQKSARRRGRVCRLVFAEENSFSAKLLKRLAEQSGDVLVTVSRGADFARLNEHAYVLNPLRTDDYRQLLDRLRLDGNLPDKLLHLWSVSTGAQSISDAFEQQQVRGFESLSRLGKALGEINEAAEIIVVSNNLQSVTGTEDLQPEKATLLAPCKTIPQEYPQLACRSVDIVLTDSDDRQERRLIDQLLAEFDTTTSEPVVAYRHGSRWVQAYEEASFDETVERSPPLREGGVYLITGGLGRIGLRLAEYLAGATRAKVALIGRSPFPPRTEWDAHVQQYGEDETSQKIRRLLTLEEAGAEIRVFEADSTDEERMRAVVKRVEEELGQINGVIHAAGIGPEQTFRLLADADEPTEELFKSPKVQGLLVLDRVLPQHELDFCLLMSSLASVLGGLGYTSYVAVNLFMDALAQKQHRLGARLWTSVNWDAWIFEDETRRDAGFGASLAETSLTPDEGVQVFRQLLSVEPVSQVVISTASLQERIDRWVNLEPRSKGEQESKPELLYPRPTLPTSYVAPETETEKTIAAVIRQLLGVVHVGIHDDFFALGGDSLLAIQLISRLRVVFHCEIAPHEMFDASTVATLAALVENGRAREQAVELQPILPVPRGSALPLSSAQQRLWVVCQLGRGETAYNLPTATLLGGSLDVSALEQSLNEVVRRHETLRTCFHTVDGQPLAVIVPPFDLELPCLDLGELPPEERQSHALRLAVEDAQKPFDMTRGPLLRAHLLRTDVEEHVLVMTMHHIVTDGWSMGVLIDEVATLYEAFSKGAPSPLPDLAIQYFDFAHWQKQTLTGRPLAALLDYWKGKLGANLPKLELPADRPRASVNTFRAATSRIHIPPTLAEPIKALGREERATLFMTLLAAFKVLLRHYSGEQRVAVGTDVANRQRAEIEDLIGFFVNQLVLLTDLSGNPSFKSLLARVREVALGAFSHQELPFEMLMNILKPEREATYSPLFQVKFVLQNAPQPSVPLSNLSLRPLEVENPYAKFDLLLTLWESDEGLSGTFEYKAELFDAETIEGMIQDYEAILRAVVGQRETTLSSLDELLDEARRRRDLAHARAGKDAAQMKLKNIRRKPISASTK